MTIARRSVLSARALAVTSVAVLGVALLAGCGGESGSSSTSPSAATTTATASNAAALTLADSWVKASPSGMTGVFGILKNNTSSDITVVGGSSPAASMVEMHEVAMIDGAMKMRPKEGGFVVPANGSHELKPGGDHVMLMGLTGPIVTGQTVTLTLKTADGATATTTMLAKEFAGAKESYVPSAGASMSPGMSMGSASPARSASS